LSYGTERAGGHRLAIWTTTTLRAQYINL